MLIIIFDVKLLDENDSFIILQNRLPVTAIDSDDSGSDWDSTVAGDISGNPIHQSPERNSISIQGEGDYATVLPKPRTALQGRNHAILCCNKSFKIISFFFVLFIC